MFNHLLNLFYCQYLMNYPHSLILNLFFQGKSLIFLENIKVLKFVIINFICN